MENEPLELSADQKVRPGRAMRKVLRGIIIGMAAVLIALLAIPAGLLLILIDGLWTGMDKLVGRIDGK